MKLKREKETAFLTNWLNSQSEFAEKKQITGTIEQERKKGDKKMTQRNK